MLRLLYRSFFADRGRLALSILAVGSAIMVVVVLEGFKVGLWQQIRSYREHLPVELVATAALTSNSVMRAPLPAETVARVQAVPGVQKVHPLVSAPAIYEHAGMKTPIVAIGYGQVGGPWALRSGRNNAAPGEMVMDYSLARKHNISLGDNVPLFGRQFKVVGVSSSTASMLGSYVFIGLEDAFSILAARAPAGEASPGTPTMLLIQVAPGALVPTVRSAIEDSLPAVDLLTPRELAANDVAIIKELMGPATDLMIIVAYLVGILIIGFTLYATVFDRLREVGVMKAVGASNLRLYQYVLGQAAAYTAAGFALGLVGGVGVAALMSLLVPQYLVVPLAPEVLIRSGGAALIMASLASALPVRQVAGVDPATVFKQ